MSREKWDNQFLERFATEFVKYKNLWEPSQDKELVTKETKLMEQALGLSGRMTIRLSRFRNKYRQKIRAMCSKSRSTKKGVQLHMRLAPRWLRILDQHMHLSEDGNDDKLFCPAALRLQRWLEAAVCALERARRVSAAEFAALARDLHRYRLSADQHRNMWQVVCGQVVRKLMQRGTEEVGSGGDGAGAGGDGVAVGGEGELTHLDWRVLDVLLLYVDNLPFLQVTEEREAAWCPWRRVLRAARRWRLRAGDSGTREAWRRLARGGRRLARGGQPPGAGIYDPSRAESVVLLQRRWFELQVQARAAFCRYRAAGDPPPALLACVLRRYPEVLLRPLPCWSELVDSGKIHVVPMSEVEASAGCGPEEPKISKDGAAETVDTVPHSNTNVNSETSHININKSKIKDVEINPKDIVDNCEKRVSKLTKENLAIHDAKDKLDDKSTTSVHATHVEVETIELLQSIDPSQVQTSILFDSDDDDFNYPEKRNKLTPDKPSVSKLDSGKVVDSADANDSDSCKSLVIDEANDSNTSGSQNLNKISTIVRNMVDGSNNDEKGQDSDKTGASRKIKNVDAKSGTVRSVIGKYDVEVVTIIKTKDKNDKKNAIATRKKGYDKIKKLIDDLKKPDKTKNRETAGKESFERNINKSDAKRKIDAVVTDVKMKKKDRLKPSASTKLDVDNGGKFDPKITMIPMVTIIDVLKYPAQAIRRKRHISDKNDVCRDNVVTDDADKESDINERKKKKVELADIEEVRRINSNILTAQVAPNTVSESSDSLEDLNEETIKKIVSCMKEKKVSGRTKRASRSKRASSCCAARALLAGGGARAAGHYRACRACTTWQLLAEPRDARDFLLGEIMHRKQTLPIRRTLTVTNTNSSSVKRKKEDDISKNDKSQSNKTDGSNKGSEKADMDEWIRQKNLVANVYGVKPRNIQISSQASNTENTTVTPNIVITSNPNVATTTYPNMTASGQPNLVVHSYVVDCDNTNMIAPLNTCTANCNYPNMPNNNIHSPLEANNVPTFNNVNVANINNTNPVNAQVGVSLNVPCSDIGNVNNADAANMASAGAPIACSIITISTVPNTTLIIETYSVNDNAVAQVNKQDNSVIDLTESENVPEDIQPKLSSAQDKDKSNPTLNKDIPMVHETFTNLKTGIFEVNNKRKNVNPLNRIEKKKLEESPILTVDDESSTSIEIPEFVEYCNVKNNKKPDVLIAHDDLKKVSEIEDKHLETQSKDKQIESLNKDLPDGGFLNRNSTKKDVFKQNAQHSTENHTNEKSQQYSNNLSKSVYAPVFVRASHVISNNKKPDHLIAHNLNQIDKIKENPQIIKQGDASKGNYQNNGDLNVTTNTNNLTADMTPSPLNSNSTTLANTETQSHPVTVSQKCFETSQTKEGLKTSCDGQPAPPPSEATKPVNYIKVKSWDFLCKKPSANKNETLFDLMVSKQSDLRSMTTANPSAGRVETNTHLTNTNRTNGDGIAAGNSYGNITANSPCSAGGKDERLSVIKRNELTAAANVNTYVKLLAPSTDFTKLSTSTLAPSTIDKRMNTSTTAPCTIDKKMNTCTIVPGTIDTRMITCTLAPSTIDTRMNTSTLAPKTIDTRINACTLAPSTIDKRMNTITIAPGTIDKRMNTCTIAPGTIDKKMNTCTIAPSTIDKKMNTCTIAPSPIDKKMNTCTIAPSPIDKRMNTCTITPGTIDTRMITCTLALSTIDKKMNTSTIAPGTIDKRMNTCTIAPSTVDKRMNTCTLAPGTIDKRMKTSTIAPGTIDKRMTTSTIAPGSIDPKMNTCTIVPSTIDTRMITCKIVPSTTVTKMNTITLAPCTIITKTTLASVTACVKANTSTFAPNTTVTKTNTTCTNLATITAGTKKSTQTPAPSTAKLELAKVISARCTVTSVASSTAPNTVSSKTSGAKAVKKMAIDGSVVTSPDNKHSDTTITPVVRVPNYGESVYRFCPSLTVSAREYARHVSARRVPVLLAGRRARPLAGHVLVTPAGPSRARGVCYSVPLAAPDHAALQIRRIVFDKRDSSSRDGQSSDQPAERVRVGDKVYQLISANPLVYSQVLFVVQSVGAAGRLLAARRPVLRLAPGGGLARLPPPPPPPPPPAPALPPAEQLLLHLLQLSDVSHPPTLTINTVGHSSCCVKSTVTNSTDGNSGRINSTDRNITVGNSTNRNSTVRCSTVGNSTIRCSTVGNPTVGNSTVGNRTVRNSTVGNGTVGNSTVRNSTVGNSTVGNSTVGNRTVGNSTFGNSTVGNGTVGNSTVRNSTVGNSTVGNSTVGNSTAGNSTVGNRTVRNSTVGNSTVGNCTDRNSSRRNNTVENSSVGNSTDGISSNENSSEENSSGDDMSNVNSVAPILTVTRLNVNTDANKSHVIYLDSD